MIFLSLIDIRILFMLEPKVSIIIPVYGVERYIERCVRSLFNQTLDELQYIFIDDCSPDHSSEIIQRLVLEYPHRQAQVNIVRNERNSGVSRSRQIGVDMATGEYVIHCDPDDWVNNDMYELLYTKAVVEDLDVVLCDFMEETEGSAIEVCQEPEHLSSIAVLKGISGRSPSTLHGSLCTKLIRRACLEGVMFPADINYCEDVAVLFQVLNKDRRVGYIPGSFYHYRVDVPGSLVKKLDRAAIDMDNRLIRFLKSLTGCNDAREYTECIHSMIVAIIYHRAFFSDIVGSREFNALYSTSIKRYIGYNRSIRNPYRCLLLLAANRCKGLAISIIRLGRVVKSVFGRIRNYCRY